MTALAHIRSPGLAALGFALMLSTTSSYGQAASDQEGPPHNVVYWNFADDGIFNDTRTYLQAGQILPALQYSKYTDVIFNFVTADNNCNLSPEPNIKSAVDALHMFGKTVLLSFGGSTSQTSHSAYAACVNSGAIPQVAQMLAKYVSDTDADGVDIDFEDTSALQSSADYDGVYGFLIPLTNNLYNALTALGPGPNGLPRNIITHAPQTPYWFGDDSAWPWTYGTGPYLLMYQALINAGQDSQIAWFNNQFYSNCGATGFAGSTRYDCTALARLESYYNIVNAGVPSIKLVMGFPLYQDASALPFNPDNGNDVTDVLTQLQQWYPNRFGGVMAWNLADDLNPVLPGYGQGAWSWAVWGTLKGTQPWWYAKDYQTGLCLDNQSFVMTDGCAGKTTKFFQPSVNTLVDAATGTMCLDSNYTGSVYVIQCNGGNFQNWQFFGYTIRNRQTGRCLDSNYSGNVYTLPCNWGPYQDWSGGTMGQ
jgi:chitinase